jgi:translation initiation factor 2B subunit (eIF-2B alpha/beta/delta family)
VASNNLATCHVFNNMADKALETLTELIRMDTINTVNEQILSNIKELCKVHYSERSCDEIYESLVRLVSKNSKESVNASIKQQEANDRATKK